MSTPSVSRSARRSRARSFHTGGSASVAARSKRSSTWLSLVFTCWPPGPEEREKRHLSSASGRETEPRMTWGPDTCAMIPRPAAAVTSISRPGRPAPSSDGRGAEP